MFVNLFDIVNRYRDINRAHGLRALTNDSDLLSNFQDTIKLNKGQSQFSDIYVFGDSLSDIGNAFNATKKAYAEGLPPAPPYIRGYFSNGPIWVEYLAQLLGLTSKQSTNYAIGGANTGGANTFIPNNPLNLPGLQQQLERFQAEHPQADPDALYIIWAGANDYLSGGIVKPDEPIKNLLNAVKSLASAGAQNIMVVNLPDLGLLPATRHTQGSQVLTNLTQQHNSGLATSVKALSETLTNKGNIKYFDVYSVFAQVFANPTRFGFTKVDDSALEQYANFKGYTEKFLFWDEIHPTTLAHMSLAQSALHMLPIQTLCLVVENHKDTGTYFKQSTSQSKDISLCQKYWVNNGEKFSILAYEPVEDEHYRVTLNDNVGNPGCPTFNTWYVYSPHVTIQKH